MHVVGVLPADSEIHAQSYLVPLVTELIQLWTHGVNVRQTPLSPSGRLVRAALVPVICDMPAGRKIIGFVGHRATRACPYCDCVKGDFKTVGIDGDNFVRRTRAEWIQRAKDWLGAASHPDRERLKKEHGIMWSELLNLPYWDPTQYFVVDGMHNLLLGLIQHHVRAVWGIRDASKKATIPRTKKRVKKARLGVRPTNDTSTATSPASHESAVSSRNAIPAAGAPRASQQASAESTGPPRGRTSYLLKGEDLSKIRDIIDQISTPSWLGRVARNFGDPSHGTPKADEWRTAGTVQIPLALTLLWSGTPKQSELDWFMELAEAVNIATKEVTSEDRRTQYMHHIRRYLRGLISRGFQLLPNHHASLHVGEFFPGFGPMRGWWGFPIERKIGLLQNINTNNRLGAL
ncbi:hypothetical protein AURDEDRAFT_76702, partial [Auricularia subglabra TFB-10046 SS5]